MNEILDEIEVKNKNKTYSRLSFINSLLNIGLISYHIAGIPRMVKASEGFPEPSKILITATLVFCLTGILMTILSFVKKEPSTLIKWLGAILNSLLFLFIVALVVFAKLV